MIPNRSHSDQVSISSRIYRFSLLFSSQNFYAGGLVLKFEKIRLLMVPSFFALYFDIILLRVHEILFGC